jgi:hypothetical protein
MRATNRADRIGPGRDLSQLRGGRVLAILCQQFPSNLLAQPLQHVQMLVQLLGAAANPGVLDLSQPLCPMTGIVDIPSCAGNRPAAIQHLQALMTRVRSLTVVT